MLAYKIDKYDNILNLRMFDDVTNKTTSNTEGNNLSPEMKTYYDMQLIHIAGPLLVHDQFGQKRNIPKNGGKVIEFRKFSKLPKATTPLTEGVTPDGQALDVSTITSEVHQYGGFIRLTDMLLMTAIDNTLLEAIDELGDQAGRTGDTITREVLNGGTNVQYAEGQVSARNTLTSAMKLTVKAGKLAVRMLKKQNAPKINGEYVAIIHPDVAFDLTEDDKWIEWNKYTTPEKKFNGEIGKLDGVRYIETTEAKIFAGAGADGVDVYSTLYLGANAYGVTSVEGGGLKTIIKQLGSGGTSDPLDQRATAGWKMVKTAERLVEQYMVRVETASTFSDGEAN
ncbi:MAG: N4-gp56 family major capsid protein [[Clostridium] aminophilum]|uniref:N4-gp56 family major capsid protein n=1 Tax=[Clostridium] aminophilum TaxID=1526 RepID=UPI0026F223E6|nr:N4-gp56 family major capsid protein [[Clostridium] aminophilum]MDD6195418.1 N4-gp56 family major capsid protein [[Clostridium] aminophilum]